jgi:hypothetical protein
MFTIKLLCKVNNINVALEVMRSFAKESFLSTGTSMGENDELQRLIAHLPENPNRNICLWLLNVTLEISAPASWWNQLNQYDVEVFILRQQSRSDGSIRLLSQEDFEESVSEEKLAILNNYIRDGQFETLQRLLPASIIRRGFIKVSYKTLNEIYCDRSSGAVGHWETFLRFLESLPYADVIVRC